MSPSIRQVGRHHQPLRAPAAQASEMACDSSAGRIVRTRALYSRTRSTKRLMRSKKEAGRQCDRSDQPAHQGPAPTSEHLQRPEISPVPPLASFTSSPLRSRRAVPSTALEIAVALSTTRGRSGSRSGRRANGGPAAELTWEAGDHPPLEEQSLAEAAELLHPLELRWAGEDPGEHLHGESLDAGQHAVLLLVPDDLAAQVQEDFGDVDLHRANIVAGATER